MENIGTTENLVLLCRECRSKSGYGKPIEIVYTTSEGGWSPRWEGRVCLHVTREHILDYYKLAKT